MKVLLTKPYLSKSIKILSAERVLAQQKTGYVISLMKFVEVELVSYFTYR